MRYELLLPDHDEDAESLEAVLPGEAPTTYVKRVTLAKLDAARARLDRRGLPSGPLLCSDTTVALGRRIFGKPADEREARAMLTELAGKEHRVITAVAVGTARRTECRVNTSRVLFAPVPAPQIVRYVASGEPMGKAGAYAIQSQAAAWIERIAGSYSGIMGLPLYETALLLQRFGVRF